MNNQKMRPEMNEPDDLDDMIDRMNLKPSNVDIDSISVISSSDSNKQDGITLNI